MGSLFFNTVAWMHVPKVIQFTENLLFFDVAARVAAEWGLTHAARQTAHMPAQVVNLQRGPEKWAEVNQEGFQGKRPGLECELLKQPRIKKWRNNKEKQYPSSKIKKREKSTKDNKRAVGVFTFNKYLSTISSLQLAHTALPNSGAIACSDDASSSKTSTGAPWRDQTCGERTLRTGTRPTSTARSGWLPLLLLLHVWAPTCYITKLKKTKPLRWFRLSAQLASSICGE